MQVSAVQGKVLDAKRIKGDGKLGIEGGRKGGDRGWRGGGEKDRWKVS